MIINVKRYTMLIVISFSVNALIISNDSKNEDDLNQQQKVDKLYEKISGYGLSEKEETLFNAGPTKFSSTYGEITWESMKRLIDDLTISNKDVFYDLGCGVGKAVVQVYLTTPVKKSVGIELAPKRIQGAKSAQSALEQEKLSKQEQSLEFYQANFLDIPLHDATIVYMCSTCFSKELMEQVMNKLVKEGKPGLKVITFKQLPENTHFTLDKQYGLPTSWSSSSPVYVYTLTDTKQTTALKNNAVEKRRVVMKPN